MALPLKTSVAIGICPAGVANLTRNTTSWPRIANCIAVSAALTVDRTRRSHDTGTVRPKFLCSMSTTRRFGLGAVALSITSSVSAQSHCDPSLAPSSNHPFGYVDRGDRCEGVYIQLVGSTTLKLLSFTAAFDVLDLRAAQPLVIEWPAPPGASEVELRALSLRRRLFYRMDTSVRAGSTRYRWPTDILAAVNLGRADIGLVGWTRLAIGGAEQEVLLPLAASQRNPQTPTGPYTLLVQPAAELDELFLTVTRLAADGSVERTVQPARELGYGYYPVESTIEIPIDAPAARGMYAVQLGARLRGGGASTLRFVFHAPGH